MNLGLITLFGYRILGLCNNYGYVIMLSAAHDILEQKVSKGDIWHIYMMSAVCAYMYKYVSFKKFCVAFGKEGYIVFCRVKTTC